VNKVTTQYAPFIPQYQDDANRMLVFQPRVERTDDGDPVFDYTGQVSGDIKEQIRIPRSIQMRSVGDFSDEESRQIVSYCSECYYLPPDYDTDCPRHGACNYGNVYAEPLVSSDLVGDLREPRDDLDVGRVLESLSAGALTARVQVDGVELEITPAIYGDGSWYLNYDDQFAETIYSGQTPIGFSLDTRGVVWELEPLIDAVIEDAEYRKLVEEYKSLGRTGLDEREVAVHTAAHYLLLIISDVSGASPNDLLYGYTSGSGDEAAQVSVFERTEGGQGVTDLLFETLEDNPSKVLEALVRVGYNVQLENQRLWRSETFRDRIQAVETGEIDESLKAEIKGIVTDASSIPYELVTESLTEEVISTIDNIERLVDEQEHIDESRAYGLKGDIVSAQFNGMVDEADVIEALQSEYDEADLDFEQVGRLLVSPDVDGCVANLQVPNCTATAEQEEALSYLALSALREQMLSLKPSAEAIDQPTPGEGVPAPLDELDETVIISF